MRNKWFEYSKIIVYIVSAVVIAVTVFTAYMVYDTKDLSPLAYLIPAVFGAFSAITGFYFSKAKKENEIKLRMLYGPEVYNDVKGEN